MTPTCATCRFWKEDQCRIGRPALVYFKGLGLRLWPVTQATDWCGEFSPVPEGAPTDG